MLEPVKGLTIAGRYCLGRKLGEGGMGSVWSAHDEKLLRDVAIKLVTERIADSKTALTRFEREARSVARLRSPYIAQLYDYGVEDGSPYIIMELLEGEDLKALIAREIRLTMEETARVVVQVAKALHAAHTKGIIHRDLKPANVFIADVNGEQMYKVFDFGVAKTLNEIADDGETTAEGVLLGTPRYMSPEQAHGAKRVDHRSDLWALGVIAYICVTGRLPFVAAGTGHVLVKICTEDPPKPSELIGHLPEGVDQFFAKALAKDPEDRFQDAKEMGIAFAELAEVSMSAFSLLSSSPGQPSPSWEGYPSSSDAISDPSAATRSERGLSWRSQGDATGDGTLGPATTSVDAGPSWLGSRGARVGAGLAAAIALAGLIGVALSRSGADPTQAPAQAADVVAPPVQQTAAEPTSPPAEDVPEAKDEDKEPKDAVEKPKKSAKPRHTKRAAKAKDEPAPEEPPTPKPVKPVAKPKPKSKDGLDLFDGRW